MIKWRARIRLGRSAARAPSGGSPPERAWGPHLLRGLRGFQARFELGDLVAQQQSAFLQPPQSQLVAGSLRVDLVDQVVEVGVFHPQFDQSALRRMKVIWGFHGVGHSGRSLYCRS